MLSAWARRRASSGFVRVSCWASVSCRRFGTWRPRNSPGSSVGGMGYLSDDECQEPGSCTDSPLRRNEVAQTSRDVEAGEYAIDGPVILGPGLPPEDGSCGQFAVQFHVTTTTVVGLKRIADARGVSVPELCRQVVGVFVAQQEGELGALLAAEAEVADYRPSLRQS